MNARFVKSFIAVGVLAVASIAPLAAAEGTELQINIPFAFVAGGQKLPAGQYYVQVVNGTGLVEIRSRSGQSANTFTVPTGNYISASEQPGLSFDRNEQGEPVLTKIQLSGQPTLLVNSHSAQNGAKAVASR